MRLHLLIGMTLLLADCVACGPGPAPPPPRNTPSPGASVGSPIPVASATSSGTPGNGSCASSSLLVTVEVGSACSSPGPLINVAIVVSGTATGAIGPSFIGFSYEKANLSSGLFQASDADLVGLFTRLGPSFLRIGGNSVDSTFWDPTGPGGVTGKTGPSDITRLASLAQAANWKVLYGINLGGEPYPPTAAALASAASEAANVAKTLGSSLYGFEIGNEPDLYHQNGHRPASYNVQSYISEFDAYAAAIKAQVPNAAMTGPASNYDTTGFSIPFAQAEGTKIRLLNHHFYMGNGQSPTSTIAVLLAPPSTNLITKLQALQTAAKSNNIPDGYRIAETNNFYNSGAPGVSDTFASALWAIDYIFTNAQNGSSGLNFHTNGDGTGYTPIADNLMGSVVGVRPEYYGMLLVALAGQGTVAQTQVSAGTMNVTAYALGSTPASISSVIVVNKGATNLNATVRLPMPAQSATLTLLTAASVSATSGETIGGGTIGLNGSVALTPTPLTVTGGVITLSLPAGSAGLVQIK